MTPTDDPMPELVGMSDDRPQNAPPTLLRARRRVLTPPINRLPPHSPEAEAGVLGSMLLSPQTCVPEAITLLGTKERFYDHRNQMIFEALVKMFDKGMAIDAITLQQFLKDTQPVDEKGRPKDGNLLEMVGGVGYLLSLSDHTPSAANLSYYANIVVEKWVLRRTIQVCTETIGRLYDYEGEVDGLMDDVESKILSIRAGLSKSESFGMKELIPEAIDEIEAQQNLGTISGLATGFPDLDKLIGGLKAGEVITIAGRPSLGKSALSMNITDNVACELGIPVGVFSLEMTRQSLTKRLLCSRARVNSSAVRDGFLAERDFPKLTAAAGKLSKSNIRIDDSAGLTIMEIRARARIMYQQHGVRLFVIDYLQLAHGTKRDGKQTREREVAEISEGTKALAKELNVPVIVLSQLNRDCEREKNKKPQLSNLRESGSVENDSDVVGLLYRTGNDDDVQHEECVPVRLSIAKNRNGPTGDVDLTFLKQFTRFESAAKICDADLPPDYQSPHPND